MNNYDSWKEIVHKAEATHWWYKARREIISHVFWKTNSATRPLRILSIGVGQAAELVYLSQFGTAEGLDIDEDHVKFGQAKGFTVHHQDATQCSLPSESYDIIFAMDVLEHIEEDRKAYDHIIRLLKKNGKLVVTVPAYQWLWTQRDELNEHKRRYTKKTLRALLSSPQIKLQKCSYYNFFLFPLLLVRRLFFSKVGHDDINQPVLFFNKLLFSIFQGEKYFLKYVSFPWGGSLIAILAKK